jgi:phosphoribosylaminoimidazolecarboxamide formyltransferase / IMP cyclohydrolase
MTRIRRAILSCYDKTGLVEFAQALHAFDVTLICTTGTAETLNEAGIPASNITDFTGVQELMGGRVKTLDPKIHAGLLGIRESKVHTEQLHAQGFEWIDMVVANFRPLEPLMARPEITLDEVVDAIDIGGIAMVRSGAKNFRHVAVVVNPERYSAVTHDLRANDGAISFGMRTELAREAFESVWEYDRVVADYLARAEPSEQTR